MVIGMIQSQNVHRERVWRVCGQSRSSCPVSLLVDFAVGCLTLRINVVLAHHVLIQQALSECPSERLYLSLDTTVVWNSFCIVWEGVVYRGRTVPVAWRVVAHSLEHGTIVDDFIGYCGKRHD